MTTLEKQAPKLSPQVSLGTPSSDQTYIQGLKYLWKIKNEDDFLIRTIAHDHNISIPVAHVLYSRGHLDKEKIRSFLFSSYEKDVPHASGLKGIDIAVQRILQAIENQEKILIFGDYDVDGVTSSSLMLLALIPLGAQINFYLPNRVKDGYGLSTKAVKRAAQNGFKLIITVDNGITAQQAAQEAQELGIDLIITDHHRPHGELPKALCIINPNQDDCPYPYKKLAGVGVTFKLMSLIYELKNLSFPDKIYELLTLGTIADVVPLTGENRYWVRYGLSKINKQTSLAFNVLAQNSSLSKSAYNSLDIGFMIAPQINALGRLDDAREAVKFMISSDLSDVERIGKILKEINEARKKVDRTIYEEIEGAIINKSIDLERENIIIAAHTDWPAGVIGLVAGKLMHNYGRPTLLFHLDNKEKVAKGSCRSIPEFNIFDALSEKKDILLSFGGHSFAAGLKLKQEDLPELKAHLEKRILDYVSPQDLQPKITLDAILDLPEATQKLITDIEPLEPFGNENPQPMFLIKNATLLNQATLLKDKHLKCSIFSNGTIKQIIFFNRPELLPLLNNIGDKSFHVAAYVTKNEWQGSVKIELQGVDIAIQD